MHQNFDDLKQHTIFILKSEVAQKNSCISTSKQPRSSCEVAHKTYRFRDMYEIIDSDIEVLGFLNLSIQIGYMMLKHPVHNKQK